MFYCLGGDKNNPLNRHGLAHCTLYILKLSYHQNKNQPFRESHLEANSEGTVEGSTQRVL